MDFDQYVAARRTPVLRAAVLLGVAEAAAPALVDAVLTRSARRIARSADPDPEVYAALVAALREPPAEPPAEHPDTRTAGHQVRRDVADLDPVARGVAVLAFHAELLPAATGDALGIAPGEVLTHEDAVRRHLAAPDRLAAVTALGLAADTVHVPPLPPLARPTGRRAPALAAAAVAAAVLATAVVALTADHTDPPDGVLDPDQVPLLYGYEAQAASTLLEERGLEVGSRTACACDPAGTVLATDPPAGARVEAGDAVTVVTAFPAGGACQLRYPDRSDAWEVLRFATGRGPAPAFADEVTVVVDGGSPRVLTAAQAREQGGWGDPSPLAALAEAMTRISEREDLPFVPAPQFPVARERPPPSACGVDRPDAFGRREALAIAIWSGDDPGVCPLTVDVYRTPGDLVDGVVLRSAR